MKKFSLSDIKQCKMSDLASVAKDNEIGLVAYWKADDNILCQKVSHVRYSYNPKSFIAKHNIFCSGESVAMNPRHYSNDKDSVSYVLWGDGK